MAVKRTTATNKTRIIPEEIKENPIPKNKKILMKATYISEEYLLKAGNTYEIASALANALIKNGDAVSC